MAKLSFAIRELFLEIMQKTDAETIAFSFYLVSNSKFGFNMMKKEKNFTCKFLTS